MSASVPVAKLDTVSMSFKLSHTQALGVMVLATLLWSTAGVVSRQMTHAQGFEVTFWRSFFTLASLGILLPWLKGRHLLAGLAWRDTSFWLSGVCWSVMFTAFMLALTMTTVANVLITMAMGPVFTALLSRFVGGRRLDKSTWLAIVVASLGMVFMFVTQVQVNNGQHLQGMLVALAVPIAGAIQWNVTHHQQSAEQPADFMPAIAVGALLSSVYTAPFALPGMASHTDLAWLAALGLFQLAVPCLLAVWAAQVLKSHEVALLALLEVLFGIAWAWWGADEAPSVAVLIGGVLVLGALALNEVASWRMANE
jgi:drug/metabolite transporter (DMT)-like permease